MSFNFKEQTHGDSNNLPKVQAKRRKRSPQDYTAKEEDFDYYNSFNDIHNHQREKDKIKDLNDEQVSLENDGSSLEENQFNITQLSSDESGRSKSLFDILSHQIQRLKKGDEEVIVDTFYLHHPSLIIAGAEDGGTNIIAQYINTHPQTMRTNLQETHFFQQHHLKFSLWDDAELRQFYVSNFWNETLLRSSPSLIAFEQTPHYLFLPYVARRIQNVAPLAKILFSLKDPVARAYSHYNSLIDQSKSSFMNLRQLTSSGSVPATNTGSGNIVHTFQACVEEDIRHLETAGVIPHNYTNFTNNESLRRRTQIDNNYDYDGDNKDDDTLPVQLDEKLAFAWENYIAGFQEGEIADACAGLVGRGLYAIQLKYFWDIYDDNERLENILVLQSEKVVEFLHQGNDDSAEDLSKTIGDFLGIDDVNFTSHESLIDQLENSKETDISESDKDTLDMLKELYRPYNQALAHLLGKDWEGVWDWEY